MPTPDLPTFPVRPANRPALARIGYRLGAYPGIRDAMLRRLDVAPELALWTHRAPDDPGIALLESSAIVADILTFYQEHYANEGFLRTAAWRESVQELVRLTGYRLAPGIGGEAAFAVELRGATSVTVPAGFPIKAELEDVPDPVDFLTTTETTAHPQFGRFHLYSALQSEAAIPAHATRFEITAVDNAIGPAALGAFDLKPGEKLMLVPPPPAWLTNSAAAIADQQSPQTVKVTKVTRRLGRVIIEIEGEVNEAWAGPVRALRVGRTFRHFGHNTPVKTTYQSGSGSSMVTHQTDAHLGRHIRSTGCSGSPSYLHTPLRFDIMPLDSEVPDLSIGRQIVIEAAIKPNSSSDARRVVVRRTIRGLRAVTMSWGNVNGPSTWIDIGSTALVTNSNYTSPTADIREIRIHEATSPLLQLRRVDVPTTGAFTGSNELFYFGTAVEAAPLVSRKLWFRAGDGREATASVVAVQTTGAAYARMRRVTLDQIPHGFTRNDFDDASPTVEVFGNLVEVTQGKLETDAVLGNGDARQAFQTFPLPKAPLTWLMAPDATPPYAAELSIRVNGREWTRVDSFFGRGPLEESYIVREGADGKSYLQFGDGETGARLPSGINNVVASYRSGSGALGPGKPGSKPAAGATLDGLDKITLAGEVAHGAPPEDGGKAREAAPGKLQSLGRLVSLRDYETETLAINGVVTASAAWDIANGTPAVRLAVLLEQAQQSDEQFAALESIIREADRARGPNRHPIVVVSCELRYVHLGVSYAHDPALLAGDVDAALRAALGLAGDPVHERTGLFGLRRRRLGQREWASRVEASVQNVPGIISCRVDHFGVLPPADDPTTLTTPAAPARAWRVSCTPTELLQLHPLHLTLTPANG